MPNVGANCQLRLIDILSISGSTADKRVDEDDPEVSFAAAAAKTTAPPTAKKRRVTPFFKEDCVVKPERHRDDLANGGWSRSPRSPRSGSVSPSLSRQVSQAVEVGLDNLSGFFAGVSRTLLKPFSRRK